MTMRRLQLQRNVDIHGISGTGIVAEGVEFNDGSVVMMWLTETSTKVHYESLADLRKIHVEGHGDEENNQIIELDNDAVEKSVMKISITQAELEKELGSQRPSIKDGADQWLFAIPTR